MTKSNLILKIDRPHFKVELYGNMLKIDLKEDTRNEIRESVEAKSPLKQILGRILNMFAPLHVRLSDIDLAEADSAGNVKIALPYHRDIIVPLESGDAKTLVDKLNELIPAEKERELERLLERQRLQRIEKEERVLTGEELITSGPASMPMPEPRGVRKLEEKAEKEIEKQED